MKSDGVFLWVPHIVMMMMMVTMMMMMMVIMMMNEMNGWARQHLDDMEDIENIQNTLEDIAPKTGTLRRILDHKDLSWVDVGWEMINERSEGVYVPVARAEYICSWVSDPRDCKSFSWKKGPWQLQLSG